MNKVIDNKHILQTGTTKNSQPVYTLFQTHWEHNGNLRELLEHTYLKAWYEVEPTEQQISEEITLNDWARWNKELVPGQRVQVSEEIYYNLLGCVPPRIMQRNYFEVGEANHHESNGKAIHRACWIENGLYYTGYPQ